MTERRFPVIRILMGAATLIGLAACGSFGNQPDSTLAPLITAATSTSDAGETTISSASSAGETTPDATTSTSSTTEPRRVQGTVKGPFPISVPTGKCTPEAIRADFGTAPQAWLECAGAWAVTRVENCPPDVECEGVDIFRWTNTGWVHRGMTYSLCVLMVDETGLPRSINDQLLAGNTDCVEPIRYVVESSTGSLQVGSKGERTRRLQRRLIEWRLLEDTADGFFGANTRNAVIDFQHLAGLQPTGIVDERTMRALDLPWP